MVGSPRAASREAWDALEQPWQLSFELAWQAYGAGSAAVGAVVVDGRGVVVARGRHAVFGPAPGGAGLAGSPLGHAEVNALATLDPTERYEDHALYVTLEPCALCVGAVVAAAVGTVHYRARDPYAGAARQVPLNAHTARLPPAFDGPFEGPFATLAVALALEPYLRLNPDGHVARMYGAAVPEVAALAQQWMTRRTLAGPAEGGVRLTELLPHLWNDLEVGGIPGPETGAQPPPRGRGRR